MKSQINYRGIRQDNIGVIECSPDFNENELYYKLLYFYLDYKRNKTINRSVRDKNTDYFTLMPIPVPKLLKVNDSLYKLTSNEIADYTDSAGDYWCEEECYELSIEKVL